MHRSPPSGVSVSDREGPGATIVTQPEHRALTAGTMPRGCGQLWRVARTLGAPLPGHNTALLGHIHSLCVPLQRLEARDDPTGRCYGAHAASRVTSFGLRSDRAALFSEASVPTPGALQPDMLTEERPLETGLHLKQCMCCRWDCSRCLWFCPPPGAHVFYLKNYVNRGKYVQLRVAGLLAAVPVLLFGLWVMVSPLKLLFPNVSRVPVRCVSSGVWLESWPLSLVSSWA